MNRKYGKLTNGAITYAPNAINNDFNAQASAYLAAGWKFVNTAQPSEPAPTGYHYETDGWEETDTTITRKWKTVASTPVYSVEEVVYGLIEAGALQAVKSLVGDYWELFTMRDTIASDNEIWQAKWPDLKSAIIAQGILTDDQITAILKEAEVEG